MRANRGKSRWTLVMLAVIAVAAGIELLRHRPTYSLLQYAASIGAVPDESMIVWLSDHEFLAGQFVRNHVFHGTLYDARTGTHRSTDQTLLQNQMPQSTGGGDYVVESFGPGQYVNVNVWDQHKIDAARANARIVNLVGIASPPVPLNFCPPVNFTLNGSTKAHPAARAVTLHAEVAFSVVLPYKALGLSFLFSPQKDRWVTTIRSERTSMFPVWLRRFLPRGGKQDIESVYTGRTDGTGTRCLGDVAVSPVWNAAGQEIRHGTYIRSLQWLPDGKHLSFVYNRTIYTLPVQ